MYSTSADMQAESNPIRPSTITIGAKALSALADTPSRLRSEVLGGRRHLANRAVQVLGPCGLSIGSAAESDQNVKRAPITGAVLFLFKYGTPGP
jgi:hypothetical protein